MTLRPPTDLDSFACDLGEEFQSPHSWKVRNPITSCAWSYCGRLPSLVATREGIPRGTLSTSGYPPWSRPSASTAFHGLTWTNQLHSTGVPVRPTYYRALQMDEQVACALATSTGRVIPPQNFLGHCKRLVLAMHKWPLMSTAGVYIREFC